MGSNSRDVLCISSVLWKVQTDWRGKVTGIFDFGFWILDLGKAVRRLTQRLEERSQLFFEIVGI
ncbi:MAG TPA: hypothetical protein VHB99_17450, partial [Pirellulales bacterium]|nr:hypothetical protein [Pirellulales bacterium]